ncbi:alpha/beta hydrolase [Microlunatus soli]|uniref:Carboxylesterase n=1 Tax=Microlunatus soli TaxID=630515 RepID=A0A1H1PKU7_9ACTN|nr:alpha/beta fold hydrolase [Microlunatus soli]SDS11882.1 carboxylesterase [Microlunatus soli]
MKLLPKRWFRSDRAAGSTGPASIGPASIRPASIRPGAEPYAAGDGDVGVLLIHGFTGSPASLRPWAEQLVAEGYRVRVPRLPGHGTSWQELNLTGWHDWYRTVEQAYLELAGSTRTVVVGGLSMGGALALRLAELHPVAGLCLVNPALRNNDPRLVLLPILKRIIASTPGISNDIARPFADEIGYSRTPLRAVGSMLQLWDVTIASLHRVDCPILLFRSLHDHVVDPSSVRLLRDRIGSAEIDERELRLSFHVATLDYDAPYIISESSRFVRRVSSDRIKQ